MYQYHVTAGDFLWDLTFEGLGRGPTACQLQDSLMARLQQHLYNNLEYVHPHRQPVLPQHGTASWLNKSLNDFTAALMCCILS